MFEVLMSMHMLISQMLFRFRFSATKNAQKLARLINNKAEKLPERARALDAWTDMVMGRWGKVVQLPQRGRDVEAAATIRRMKGELRLGCRQSLRNGEDSVTVPAASRLALYRRRFWSETT